MELAVLVLLASRLLTDQAHAQLAASGFGGLRPAHFFAFQLIGSTGGATGVQLAEHLGVSRQAAGQMVDELSRLGMVERRHDPQDARLRRIVLTAQGREAIAAALPIWNRLEREWEALVGEATMAEMRAGLLAWVGAHGGLDRPLRLRPTW